MEDLGIPGLTDIEEIGAGGNGVVYRARQVELDRLVAVKMVHLANNAETIDRFTRECRTMARIAIHPGIAPIFESGTSATGKPYLIMPFYEAGSLADRMAAGAMPWTEAARIMVSVADAMDHAHAIDVIHRDLKPDNIMIDGRGEPVVVDFGIAKLVGSDSQSIGIHLTPSYAPPEAFDGTPPDRRYDVYALGATLHALIAGRLPFPTEGGILAIGMQKATQPPPDLRIYAPDAVCRTMERAMAIDPAERQQTAAEFGQELAQAAGIRNAPVAEPVAVDDVFATRVAGQIPPASVDYQPPGSVSEQAPAAEQAPATPQHFQQPTPTPAPQQPYQTPTPPPQQPYQAPTPPPQQPYQAPTPPPQQPYQTPTPPPQQPYQAPTPPPQQPYQTPTPPPQQPLGYQASTGANYQQSQPGLYGVNSVSGGGPVTAPTTGGGSSNGPLLAALAAVAVLIVGGLAAVVLLRDNGDVVASDDPEGPGIDTLSGDDEPGDTGGSTDTDNPPGDNGATDDDPAIGSDRSSGDVAAKDMQIGDCFDIPATAGIFDTVELRSCDEAHFGEVVAVLEHPDAGTDYPGIEELTDYGLFPCADGFERYVGVNDEYLTELESGGLYPTFDEWQDGIFVIPCYAARWDGEPLTTTVRDRGGEPDVNLDFGDLNGLDRLFVGDCFTEVDNDLRTFPLRQTVTLVDCAEVNDGEVIGFIDLAGPASGQYDVNVLLDEALATCSPIYTDYTGDDIIEDSGLNGIVPDGSEWSSSVRWGVCVVLKFEGGEPGSVAFG